MKRLGCRSLVALALALSMVGMVGGGAGAATTGTEAGAPATPVIPAPEECQAEPLTGERIDAVLALPEHLATPEAGLPPVGQDLDLNSEAEFPTGNPADEDTERAIAAVIYQLMACYNANASLPIFSLLSDAYLRNEFLAGAEAADAEELKTVLLAAAEGTPEALPEAEQIVILEMRDARVFADGRAGIVAVTDWAEDDLGPSATLFVLVQVDGRWLIDAAMEVMPVSVTAAAGDESDAED